MNNQYYRYHKKMKKNKNDEFMEYACGQTLLIPLCPKYKLLLNGGYMYGTMFLIYATDKLSIAYHKALTALGVDNQFMKQSVLAAILCIGTERAFKILRATGYDPFLRKLINVAKDLEKIMNECYERAKKILLDNKGLVESLAKTLYEKETITKEEIEEVVNVYNEEHNKKNGNK